MKYLLLNIILFYFFSLCGQTILNERYDLNSVSTIFGSVIATDSCYYVTGICANESGVENLKAPFIRFNLDGIIHTQSTLENDTMGFATWESPNLIKTLDGNFAQIATTFDDSNHSAYMFIKYAPNGDTLVTNYINEFYEEDSNIAITSSKFFQNSDSSYTCLVHPSRTTDLVGALVLFKLDKTGQLLWHKNYYGLADNYYRILKGTSLIKYDNNTIIIGGTLLHTPPHNEDKRHHVKIIKTDTLGSIIQEYTYWDDLLSNGCNGLTKTIDGGLLYCGQNGQYFQSDNSIEYKGHIVKLKPDFTFDWRIELGISTGFAYVNFNNILPLNDTEFVAIGKSVDTIGGEVNIFGWMVKFNINGEVIWERKFYKVPNFGYTNNLADHNLYDIDITPDGGFVMVGQSINTRENEHPYGQLGWLVKTDSYGCLVPNCQYLAIEPSETKHKIVLYPNPIQNDLYLYLGNQNFTENTQVFIYNLQGQIMQNWEAISNNITYMVDVSNFVKGVYVLKIQDGNHVIWTEKIVVSN